MKSVDLNAKWHIATEGDEIVRNLPYDATAHAARDYTCAFGELNGYVPAARAVFTKELPAVRRGKAYVCISGSLGYGDVFINGDLIGRVHGVYPHKFDVTGLLGSSHNELKLELVSVPGMSDKYVGLGIGGGVTLVTEDDIDIEHGSLFVTTETTGDKTYADVTLSVKNDTDAAQKIVLDCTLLNNRGKRCGKKQRKIFVRARSSKSFTVRVRINKAYEWTLSDPYVYTAVASLIMDGDSDGARSVSTTFGVVTRALNPVRGLYINNKNTDLFGAYVSHADAILGGASVYTNEKRRFEALKGLGYNAVHFVECPSDAALRALDDIGMYAYVDIFSALGSGKAPLDAHIFGEATAIEESVIALRNHPCVAIYGVADDVPECYGRNDGYAVIEEGVGLIKSLDDTRPVTVSTHELVPTTQELENAGVKRRMDSDATAINAGREKDLFDTLTEPAFSAVDVCGFNYLYPLYGSDKLKHNRLILGSRTDSERAFESVDETEKNLHVIGDFADCGIDYPGGGKLNEILCSKGDLDAIGDDKIQGAYKRIILGGRNLAYLAVLDPDTDEPVAMWNWPRYLGKEVTVRVYTSGDVAALYLDGRLIGRKLAGKINRHIATFTTEYYPGTLEAVCYFKGVECARAKLKTAGSPKSIRLTAYEKSLSLSRGDIGFAYVDVCDREGDLVPYAMRTLTAQITGAELVGFINGDPMLRKISFDSCPAFGGRAMLAIRPDETGKAVVKVTGDGLLSSKISFKIKD